MRRGDTAELWLAELNKVATAYRDGHIPRDAALEGLRALGLTDGEASRYLKRPPPLSH